MGGADFPHARGAPAGLPPERRYSDRGQREGCETETTDRNPEGLGRHQTQTALAGLPPATPLRTPDLLQGIAKLLVEHEGGTKAGADGDLDGFELLP